MKIDTISKYDITESVIWKQILIFFFPILLGTFFQQLYNTVDAIIVGRYMGKEALSAVGGATGTLISLLVNFFVGLSSGATVIISQYYGGKKYEDVSDSVHTALGIALIGGIIMTIGGIWLAPYALRAMNTPEEIMEYSLVFLRVYFIGMTVNMIYNVGSGILRAVGDSKRPLYFLVAGCVLNIILEFLFIAVLGLGIRAAAAATVISQSVSAALVLYALNKTHEPYQIWFNKIRVKRNKLEKIFKIGMPAGIQSIMYSISNVLIQSCINSFGTDTVAAWTAFAKIDGLFWMIVGAFGMSITTFVGQNYGAGKIQRVKKGVVECLIMISIVAVSFSIVLYLSGNYLFMVFTDDRNVIEIGMKILTLLAPWYITFVAIEILSGAMRAMGNALVPMILTACGVCGLRIIWIFAVFPLKPEIITVALIYPISWSVTSVLFVMYYRDFWRRRERLDSCISGGI